MAPFFSVLQVDDLYSLASKLVSVGSQFQQQQKREVLFRNSFSMSNKEQKVVYINYPSKEKVC
jgi:hypothetical protein